MLLHSENNRDTRKNSKRKKLHENNIITYVVCRILLCYRGRKKNIVAKIMYFASWKIKGRPSVRFVMFNSKFQFYFASIFFCLVSHLNFRYSKATKRRKKSRNRVKKITRFEPPRGEYCHG